MVVREKRSAVGMKRVGCMLIPINLSLGKVSSRRKKRDTKSSSSLSSEGRFHPELIYRYSRCGTPPWTGGWWRQYWCHAEGHFRPKFAAGDGTSEFDAHCACCEMNTPRGRRGQRGVLAEAWEGASLNFHSTCPANKLAMTSRSPKKNSDSQVAGCRNHGESDETAKCHDRACVL